MKGGEMTQVHAADVAKEIVVAVVEKWGSALMLTGDPGQEAAKLYKTIYTAVRDADDEWEREKKPGAIGR